MYEVEAHRLEGPHCTYNGQGVITPNRTIRPEFLVIHYTVISYAATIRSFGPTGSRKASAHLVVSRAGEITQMVDFNRRAWHAGESVWEGVADLNSRSIGIELENHGYLFKRADGSFVSDNDDPIPPQTVVVARHAHPAWRSTFWEQYAPLQLAACEALCHVLVDHYGLRGILGHDQISPGRKADPGPAFPMERMQSVFGRDDDTDQRLHKIVAVERLNIRIGAGPTFSLAGAPLRKGVAVEVLEEPGNGWMKVACRHPTPLQGWVSAQYLASAA